jgi:hypothetical protein
MDALAISDTHLERRGLTALNESFDVLICAGDIWEGQPEKAVQSVVDLARGKPAIIVPGNHDFYTEARDRRTISQIFKIMRDEAARQNAQVHREIVTVLSADNPVCEIEHVRFIGLTRWADWAQAGRWMTDAANGIEWAARARAEASRMKTAPREYGAIRTERGRWTPYDPVAVACARKGSTARPISLHARWSYCGRDTQPSTRRVCRRIYGPSASLVGACILCIRHSPNFTRPDPTRRLDLWSCSRAIRRKVRSDSCRL